MTEERSPRASQAPGSPQTPAPPPGPGSAPGTASEGRSAPRESLRDQIAQAIENTRGIDDTSEALADAVLPVFEAETEKLRRQVMGYRGMKDTYLRERNAAHDELIKAENLIERLCDDREAGQRVVKAALTEQRQRAEKAERQRDEALAAVQRVRDLHQQARSPGGPICDLCVGSYEEPLPWPCPTIAALDQPKETP